MSLSKFHGPLGPFTNPQFEPEIKRAILASWTHDTPSADLRADALRSLRRARRERLGEIVAEPEKPGKGGV